MEDATVLFGRETGPRQVVLADAFEAGVLPTWTEAIALTRAVAWQLYRSGASTPIPALEDVALFSTGVVHVEGGRPADGDEIAGVGQLMSQLVEHVGAPPQVLDVQRRAMAQPPVFATLLEFHNALDFFARPDSKAVLAEFHARALAGIEAATKNDAFEELKEKTKAIPSDQKKKKTKKKKRPALLVVAAALLVTAVAAAAAYYYYSGDASNTAVSQTANAAMTTIAETGKKLQDVTNSVVSKLVGGAEAVPPTPPPTNESALVALATPRPRRGPAAPSASTAPAATVAPPVAVVTPSPAAPPEPDAPSTPAPPPQPFVDSGIYSASDAAVEAPVLVYPQLPSKPIDGALFTRPSELDLLVLEDGTVAEARLIPQSDRLQDRMMVSAAKAWRFRPAEKDGKPVRYRMRIPITW